MIIPCVVALCVVLQSSYEVNYRFVTGVNTTNTFHCVQYKGRQHWRSTCLLVEPSGNYPFHDARNLGAHRESKTL